MATFDLDGYKIKQPNCTSIFDSKEMRSSNKLYDFETEYGQYTLVKKNANFKKAFKSAKKMKGYLAEVSHNYENWEIYDNIINHLHAKELNKTTSQRNAGSASYVWLGGTDEKKEGKWIWLKTKDPIYSTRWEWGAGKMGKEPDNYKGEQHHLAMGLEHWPRGVDAGEGYGSASMWNDISEKNKLFFVVEYTNPACADQQM